MVLVAIRIIKKVEKIILRTVNPASVSRWSRRDDKFGIVSFLADNEGATLCHSQPGQTSLVILDKSCPPRVVLVILSPLLLLLPA